MDYATDNMEGSHASEPPTLEQTLIRLMQNMQQSQQQNSQSNLELAARIEAITSAANHSRSTITRPRERLQSLASFDGTRSGFEGWLIVARNKLEQDGDFLGNQKAQLQYIFGSLAKEAQKMCIAWFNLNQNTATADDLLAYLAKIYSDPNRARRAMNSLATMEQKDGESFARFLPRFETQLADAGALATDDNVKISWLERALNKAMRDHLQYVYPIPDTYQGYTSLLQTIASRRDALQNQKGGSAIPSRSWRTSDAMDWEPTTRTQQARPNTNGVRRAKLVDQKTLEYRRRNGLCLRCGNEGHRIGTCPFQPPQKPELKTNVNLLMAQAEKLDELENDGLENGGEESGKEQPL